MRKRAGILAVAAVALACSLPAVASAQTTPLLQVGGTGPGAGQLDGPNGVAIGPNGEVYVAEILNRRISQFSSSGAFIRAWGVDVVPGNEHTTFEVCTSASGCKAGGTGGSAALAGAVTSSQGIAVGSNGEIYSIDSFSQRIDHFSAGGEFINAFGLDVVPTNVGTGFEVCTFVTTCQQGDGGGVAGSLGDPFDLTIGPGDRLYSIYANGRRVTEVSPSGEWVDAFGFDVVPGAPEALEVCTFLTGCQGGTFGSAAGQLTGPRGIGMNEDNIFVSNNGRVDEYTPSGSFVRAFGFGVDTGAAALEICTAASGCQAPVTGGGPGQLSVASNSVDVADDGTIYVADTLGERVVAYTPSAGFDRAFGFDVNPAGETSFEVCTAATGCKLGTNGNGEGQFASLKDVIVDCRGAIWTADIENDRVTRFGEPGTMPPPCQPASPGAPAARAIPRRARSSKSCG